MPRFIGLHSLPGFVRETLARTRQMPMQEMDIEIIRVAGDESTGRIICEVEAPDRESFIAWLNQINMPYDDVCRVDTEIILNKEPKRLASSKDRTGKATGWLSWLEGER